MTAPSEITELIQNSGNNFHAKVARWFADNGWHVVISPYYMDQTQSKAREIDLIAEKLWPLTDGFGRPIDNIAVRLYVECKYVASDAVFFGLQTKTESLLLNWFAATGSFGETTHTPKSTTTFLRARRSQSFFLRAIPRLPKMSRSTRHLIRH